MKAIFVILFTTFLASCYACTISVHHSIIRESIPHVSIQILCNNSINATVGYFSGGKNQFRFSMFTTLPVLGVIESPDVVISKNKGRIVGTYSFSVTNDELKEIAYKLNNISTNHINVYSTYTQNCAWFVHTLLDTKITCVSYLWGLKVYFARVVMSFLILFGLKKILKDLMPWNTARVVTILLLIYSSTISSVYMPDSCRPL